MKGGRFEIALVPLAEATSHGAEQIEFRVASHPKQPLGPLAKVASGGELSRIALAIQVVTSEVGAVPTLIFDEVDAGIGARRRDRGTAHARRQPAAGPVRHALPQVAAFADHHFRVTKHGDDRRCAPTSKRSPPRRVSRSCHECSVAAPSRRRRARAAKELLDQHRRATR